MDGSRTRLPRSGITAALLGDDIVIADRAVAEQYLGLLKKMSVSVSEAKSLVSDNGSLEFAKQVR